MSIYTIAFGSLYNKIVVNRIDSTQSPEIITEIKVPLSYAGKLHWYYRKYKNFPDKYNIKTILPVMVFRLNGIQADPERQTNKFECIKFNKNVSLALRNWVQTAVPYKFSFTLSIWTKYQTEMNQILEQILPFYSPTRNIPIKELPLLDISRTCRIQLTGISPEESIEFDSESGDRIIQYELNFDLDGYMYPPILEEKLINEIDYSVYLKLVGNNFKIQETIITEEDGVG
jgi:hypothetical protein